MTINVDEAAGFEEFGIKFTDEDGNLRFYLTGGPGSPIGQSAPVPTVYVSQDGTTFQNFGTGPNDWNEMGSIDFSLDGGFANAAYTPEQCVDGGNANG